MLAWIGIALLSVSWLPGLGYYHGADWLTWAAMIIAGTALLGARPIHVPSWQALLAALAMILPAVWVMPWPDRAAPELLAVGLALGLAAQRGQAGRWMNAAAGVLLRAGCVLLAQSLAMVSYALATSRSHLLPSPLPRIIAAAVKALGIDAGVHGTTVAVFSMRKNHLFTVTWELLLDPPTWCFLIGGAVLLWWTSRVDVPQKGTEKRPWLGAVTRLFMLVALWLPFRAALLIALYLDCALRTEYDSPLDAMKLFWNSWVLLAMLAGPVLLAWRFASGAVRWTSASDPEDSKPSRRFPLSVDNWCYPTSAALAFVAVGLACLGLFWEPVGKRKDGRVFIEELQGDRPVWERTDKPYDTEWYDNMSGYNYYCVFNYYGHYYDVARLAAPIDDEVLKKCDVLILKIPTREYSDAEVDAIVRFVKDGGGLMLIGEHTDVFGSGTYLNKVAERFGFSYRFDCLFGVDSVFKEHYDIPLAPHPILQYMPTFDFAISCSIDPGTGYPLAGRGRAVIRNAGLKNLMADYHADNFYPLPDDSAEMEYGSFIQLLAVRCGKGRIAAFSDSTVFSNFCTFEPGKAELMLGMLEWLNHEGGSKYSRAWLWGAAAVLLCIAIWLARGWNAAWLMLAAAGLLGWSAAVWGSNAIHRHEMPRPSPQPDRPLVQLVIDRTLSDAPLSDAGFVAGKENGFGIFERWILRLGYFTARRGEDDPAYYDGNALVLMCPHLPLPLGYRERLVEYVRGGGKLLVLDTADRAVIGPASDPLTATPGAANPPVVDTRSTAGDVLEPFGLSIDVTAPVSGTLDTHGKWPSVPISKAAVVNGGEPIAWVEGRPVAARSAFGKGSVTVVGFANRFSDANMGVTGDVVPDDSLRAVYAVQFGLLRDMTDDKSADEHDAAGKAPINEVKRP